MSKVIKQLFLLEITYQSNSLLYYIQKLPFLGKYISSSVYSLKFVKVIIGVLSVLMSIVMMFVSKALYAFFVSVVAALVIDVPISSLDIDAIFLMLFLILAIAGGWGHTKILEIKKSPYYAIIHMRMNAKTVALITFFKHILMLLVGFIPAFLFIPAFRSFDIQTLAALYLITVLSKIVGASLKLMSYAKKPYVNYLKESKRDFIGSTIIFLLFIPCLIFGYLVTLTQLWILVAIFAVLSVLSLVYILKFPSYNRVYKQILAQWNNGTGDLSFKINTKEYSEKYINEGGDIDHSKKGFVFLAECFNKRHRRILFNTTRNYILISLGLAITAVVACLIVPEVSDLINTSVLGAIPVLTFYMYFMNCGERIVKIYFMNCDNEMLTYRAYRQPHAIVKMFTLRLKSVVLMDWLQSIPIAIALPLVLYISGGTDNAYEYILLFVSVMALSTFFSVHNLVIYYTLQPFNKEVEMKNPVYMVVKSVTYLVCFSVFQVGVNPIILGIVLIVFTILYTLIALPIAYRVAPKTFRLK